VVQVLRDELHLPIESRIWWCPTSVSSWLPLHVAGPYRRGEPNLPDLFVSSYTPTLGALIRARRDPIERPANCPPSILIVSQSDTPGSVRLESVDEEVQRIKVLAPHSTLLDGEQGTRESVLSNLAQHSWVHFACHGNQNHSQPFRSNFSLFDKPLDMLDLVEHGLPRAELAVLSACQTASNDLETPDEVLHLSAAMQFAGFKSVVGTLWEMEDEDGPTLSREFYRRMLNDTRGTADCTNAAVALAETVKVLRRRGVPFSRWINFVHFGI